MLLFNFLRSNSVKYFISRNISISKVSSAVAFILLLYIIMQTKIFNSDNYVIEMINNTLMSPFEGFFITKYLYNLWNIFFIGITFFYYYYFVYLFYLFILLPSSALYVSVFLINVFYDHIYINYLTIHNVNLIYYYVLIIFLNIAIYFLSLYLIVYYIIILVPYDMFAILYNNLVNDFITFRFIDNLYYILSYFFKILFILNFYKITNTYILIQVIIYDSYVQFLNYYISLIRVINKNLSFIIFNIFNKNLIYLYITMLYINILNFIIYLYLFILNFILLFIYILKFIFFCIFNYFTKLFLPFVFFVFSLLFYLIYLIDIINIFIIIKILVKDINSFFNVFFIQWSENSNNIFLRFKLDNICYFFFLCSDNLDIFFNKCLLKDFTFIIKNIQIIFESFMVLWDLFITFIVYNIFYFIKYLYLFKNNYYIIYFASKLYDTFCIIFNKIVQSNYFYIDILYFLAIYKIIHMISIKLINLYIFNIIYIMYFIIYCMQILFKSFINILDTIDICLFKIFIFFDIYTIFINFLLDCDVILNFLILYFINISFFIILFLSLVILFLFNVKFNINEINNFINTFTNLFYSFKNKSKENISFFKNFIRSNDDLVILSILLFIFLSINFYSMFCILDLKNCFLSESYLDNRIGYYFYYILTDFNLINIFCVAFFIKNILLKYYFVDILRSIIVFILILIHKFIILSLSLFNKYILTYLLNNFININFLSEIFFIENNFNIIYYDYINIYNQVRYNIVVTNEIFKFFHKGLYFFIIYDLFLDILDILHNAFIFLLDNFMITIINAINYINSELLRIIANCVIQLFYNIQLFIFSFTWKKEYINTYIIIDMYSGTEILLNSIWLKIKLKILLIIFDEKGLFFNSILLFFNFVFNAIYLALKNILWFLRFISHWFNIIWVNIYFINYDIKYFIISIFFFPFMFFYYILNCIKNTFVFMDVFTVNSIFLYFFNNADIILDKFSYIFYVLTTGFIFKWFVILYNLLWLTIVKFVFIILHIFHLEPILVKTYGGVMLSVICNPMFYIMYGSRAMKLVKDGRLYRHRLIQIYFYLFIYSSLTWYILMNTRFMENMFLHVVRYYIIILFSIFYYIYHFYNILLDIIIYYYHIILNYIFATIKSYLLILALILKTQPFVDPLKYVMINILITLNTFDSVCMSSLGLLFVYGAKETGITNCYVLYSPISTFILEPLQYLLKMLYIYLVFIVPLIIYILKANVIYIFYFIPMFLLTGLQSLGFVKIFKLCVILIYNISKHISWFLFIECNTIFIYSFNIVYVFYLFLMMLILYIFKIIGFIGYIIMGLFFYFISRHSVVYYLIRDIGYTDIPLLIFIKYFINWLFYKFITFDIFHLIGFILLSIIKYIFFKVFFIFNPFVWFKYYSNHILLGYNNFDIPRMDLMIIDWFFYSFFYKILILFWDLYEFIFGLICFPCYFIFLMADIIYYFIYILYKSIDLIIQFLIRILAVDLFEINRLFYINSRGHYVQLIHYSFMYIFSYSFKIIILGIYLFIKSSIIIFIAYIYFFFKYIILVFVFLSIINFCNIINILFNILNLSELFIDNNIFNLVLYLILNYSKYSTDIHSNIFFINCFTTFIKNDLNIFLSIFNILFETLNYSLLLIYFIFNFNINLFLSKLLICYYIINHYIIRMFEFYDIINFLYYYNTYLDLEDFILLESFVYSFKKFFGFILILPLYGILFYLIELLRFSMVWLTFYNEVFDIGCSCYTYVYSLFANLMYYIYLMIRNIFLLFYDPFYSESNISFFELWLNVFISSYFYNNIVLECVDFVNNWFIFFFFLFLFVCYVLFLQWYVSKDTRLFYFDNIELVLLSFINFISTLIRDNSPKNIEYFGLYFVIFFIIFFSNIIGMIPYSVSITSQFVFCFTISFAIVSGVTLRGFSKNRFRFGGLFLNNSSPWVIWFLLVPLEIISFISRALSLAIRLFANMTAGHVLVSIFGGIISALTIETQGFLEFIASIIVFILFSAILLLELFISFLQAYVFVLLVVLYIKDAESESAH